MRSGSDDSFLIHFIEHLLDGLADNGRCVVIVPQSTMVGKSKSDKEVKKRILTKHTLEGVITLNKETFYGVGTNPCIAIFTAQKPHSENIPSNPWYRSPASVKGGRTKSFAG